MKYVSWLTPQITVHYLSSYPIDILPSELDNRIVRVARTTWTTRSDDPVSTEELKGCEFNSTTVYH